VGDNRLDDDEVRNVSVFQPEAGCFARMSPTDFAKLAKALIQVEAIRSGLRREHYRTTQNDFAADGGIDAWITERPPRPSHVLPDKPAIFQFKWGKLQPKKLAQEITGHAFVLQALGQGHAYRLVVAEDLTPDRMASIKKALVGAAGARGRKGWDIEILNASALSAWVADFPSLTSRPEFVRAGAIPRHRLWPFAEWRRKDARTPWVDDESRGDLLRRLIDRIRTPGSLSRVTGPAGSGKTRLVLEAVREARRRRLCAYASGPEDWIFELLRGGDMPRARAGVLIVDECPESEHQRILRERLDGAQLTIVTIGVADRTLDVIPGENELLVRPLDRIAAKEVAKAMGAPTEELSQRVAEQSGGYPRLVRLLLDVAQSDPSVLEIDRHGALVAALERLLGPDATEEVRALALLRQLGWEGEAQAERRALVEALGLSEPRLTRVAHVLIKKEILRQAAEYRYLTPSLLAEWLAAETWREQGAGLFVRLRDAGMPSRGLVSALRRLVDIGGGDPRLRTLGREVLRDERLFGGASFLEHSELARFVHELSQLEPLEAVRLLERGLHGQGREDLKKKLRASRRDVVWALQRGAWAKESFPSAAALLLRLADAENESWGSNATGVFKGLFFTFLGGTEADGEERMKVLGELFERASPSERALVVCGAGAAMRQEGAGDSSPFQPGVRPQDRWRPASFQEEARYRRAAADVVVQALREGPEESCAAAKRVVRDAMRDLLVRDLADVAVILIEAMGSSARTDDRLHEVIADIERYNGEALSPRSVQALARIREIMSPRGFEETLRAALSVRFEGDEATHSTALAPLAEEFLRTEPSKSAALWEWLLTGGAPLVYDFGMALGRHDLRRSLEPTLVAEVVKHGRPRLLSGYLVGLTSHLRVETIDSLLDSWAESEPAFGHAVFDATYMGQPSVRGAARLVRLVELGRVPADALGTLVFGGWLLRIPLEAALRVLEAARVASVQALELWRQLAGSAPTGSIDDVGFAIWSAIDSAMFAKLDDRFRWTWQGVGERLARTRALAVGERTLKLLVDEGRTHALAADEMVELLAGCLAKEPNALWAVVARELEVGSGGRPRLALAIALERHLPEGPLLNLVPAWAKSGGPARRRVAARLSKAPRDAADSLGAALLDTFPGDRDLEEMLWTRFFEGAYYGPAAARAERQVQTLEQLARSIRPGLSAWAQRHLSEARRYVEQARTSDQRWNIDH
jgi:hypothetical protein